MKRYLKTICPILFLSALLVGCSLAVPATASQDTFVGYHMVVEPLDTATTPLSNFVTSSPTIISDSSVSSWTQHGEETLNLENIGSEQSPHKVLFAEFSDSGWRFPTITGINAIHAPDIELGHFKYNGLNGHLNDEVPTLDGTLLVDANKDWLLTVYFVFLSEDDRLYIDGTGFSTDNPDFYQFHHGVDAIMGFENNKITSSLDVTMTIEQVYPVAHIEVQQFDKNNQVICSQEMTDFSENVNIMLQPHTEWILIVETDELGVSRRTARDLEPHPMYGNHFVTNYTGEDGFIKEFHLIFSVEYA